MEVLIAVMILSVVMVTLLETKSDNIFLMKNSNKKTILKDYISLAINLKEANNRNKNIFLEKLYSFDNDGLRKELKRIKIKIKDKKIDTKSYNIDNKFFSITTYSTLYSLNHDVKKNIYTFKLEL